MVQIPEYTRRENAQPMKRGGMNLNLPGAITQPTGGIGEIGKRVGKLSSELADVFVGMKERRDDGIVSAFMNQYDKDSTAKLLQLQDKYRGQDAHRVMPEFQKWRDEYIAQHSTYDEDSAKEGVIYLEDAAQNRIAKQKLDATNVRDINSISSYIAREEETFRVNNLKTSIGNNSAYIVAENNPENAYILKKSIYNDVASLYRGQSKEFIKAAADEVLDSALYGNVMRDSASNPMASIDRFESDAFSKEMTTETKQKAKAQLLKAFMDYQAQQMANAQTGRESMPAGEDFYTQHASFFGRSINDYKSQIDEESVKLSNKILEKDERDRVAVLNNLSIQLIDAQSKKDPVQMAQVLSAMSGVRGGVETAELINDVDTEYNDYTYLKKVNSLYNQNPDATYVVDGKIAPSYEEVSERLSVYNRKRARMAGRMLPIIEDINHDKYESLTDIKEFKEFPPDEQENILTAFSRRARYNSLSATAQEKSGVNFDSRIREIYRSERGDPDKNPIEFNRFKYEMSQKIVQFLSENPNKIPQPKELKQMADNSVTYIENRTVYDTFSKIAQEIEEKYGDKKHRDYGSSYQAVFKMLDKKSKGVFRSAEEKEALKRATALFLDNDWEGAYNELANADLMERQDIYQED